MDCDCMEVDEDSLFIPNDDRSDASPSGDDTSGAEDTVPQRIEDGWNDIATTIDLVKMRVQADGRQPFQRVWLWAKPGASDDDDDDGTTKTSGSKPFDPEKDGPLAYNNAHGGVLPARSELSQREGAKEYLEVGIIIGSDPDMYAPTGDQRSPANKAIAAERVIMPALIRHHNAMRVFIPITQDHVRKARYYVGCRMESGKCYPKSVGVQSIFFYKEFWSEVKVTRPSRPTRNRQAMLSENCRAEATRDNTVSRSQPVVAIENTMADELVPEAFERSESNDIGVPKPAEHPGGCGVDDNTMDCDSMAETVEATTTQHNATAIVEDLEDEIDRLAEHNRRLIERNEDLEEQLHQALASATSEEALYSKQYDQLERRVARYKTNNESLLAAQAAAKTNVERLMAEHKETTERLQAKISENEETISQKDNAIDSLKVDVRSGRERADEKFETVTEKHEANLELNESLKAMLEERRKQNECIVNSNDKIKHLEEQIQAGVEQLAERDEAIVRLNDHLKAEREECKRKDETVRYISTLLGAEVTKQRNV